MTSGSEGSDYSRRARFLATVVPTKKEKKKPQRLSPFST